MSVRLYTRIATRSPPLRWPPARPPRTHRPESSKGKRIQIPANLANFREPGSTGYVPKTARQIPRAGLDRLCPETTQVTIPAWLENFRSRARPATSRRRRTW